MADPIDISQILDDPRAQLGRDVINTARNLPGSVLHQGANVLKSAAGMIPQPAPDGQGGIRTSVPTLEAIGHVIGGLVGHITGGQVSPESTAAYNALIDHYKRTYGSWQGFHQALVNDPASIALDVASIAAPIEGGLRMGSRLAEGTQLAGDAGMLSNAADAAAAVQDVANPVKAIRTATAPFREKFAQKTYEGALRPTSRHGEQFRTPVAQQGIESGVVAGRKLDSSIWDAMRDPMRRVDEGVNYYQNQGLKVNLADVSNQNVGVRPPSAQELGRPLTQQEVVASGPVYGSYGGADMNAQHDVIDNTLNDIAKGHGYPGEPAQPAIEPSSIIDPATGQPAIPGTEGTPGTPNYLGPVDFDRANDIAKKTYRDVERANKSASFDERTGPRLDTQKSMAAGIRRDMKAQADAAHAADPNAPDISTPLKQESNLMALQDMMDRSIADLHASARTLPMGGLTPIYSGVRAAVSSPFKTRFALGISPNSPVFNKPIIGSGGMPSWSDIGDFGIKTGAAGAGFAPSPGPGAPPDLSNSPIGPPDISDALSQPPRQFASGGTVTGPPTGPYKAGDARKIKGTTYVRDAMGQWHPQKYGQ